MYDFETVLDRRDTNSEKWDVAPGELPMWVADMDFRTAPAIIEAVQRKADSGVYGYTIIPPEFSKAVASWWYRRHAWDVDPSWVLFCSGVVPAISSLIRTYTKPGGNVLIQTPVYNIFFNSIRNSGRTAQCNDLVYENGVFRIDWGDLETKMSDPDTSLFILCNPQNPTGQVWSREDLRRVGYLAAKHGVVVLADEIHCDLTTPGTRYVPFASIDETCANNSITLVSATKAFNIPGLQTSIVIAENKTLRNHAKQSFRRDDHNEPNAFSIEAAIAAFTKSERWLEELRVYIHRNKEELTEFITRFVPQLSVVPSQATYLVWVDCSALTEDTTELTTFIRKETGLFINPGALYGDNGKRFVRINVACPSLVLADGLYRLKKGVDTWIAKNAPELVSGLVYEERVNKYFDETLITTDNAEAPIYDTPAYDTTAYETSAYDTQDYETTEDDTPVNETQAVADDAPTITDPVLIELEATDEVPLLWTVAPYGESEDD